MSSFVPCAPEGPSTTASNNSTMNKMGSSLHSMCLYIPRNSGEFPFRLECLKYSYSSERCSVGMDGGHGALHNIHQQCTEG